MSSPVSLPATGGFSENPSGAQLVVTGAGPAVSSSANGQSWPAPVAVGQGGGSAVTSLAPNGESVAAWIGGTSSAPVISASARPPGGSWSAPVTVGGSATSAPLIGTDASGDAVIAPKGSTGTTATWTPALLTGDFLGEGIQSAADTAGTFVLRRGLRGHRTGQLTPSHGRSE